MYGFDWVGFDFLGGWLLGGSAKRRTFCLELRLAIYLFVDDASIPPGHGPIYIVFFCFSKSG